MLPDLVVIVPSRGRPDGAAAVIQAWRDTGADTQALLLLALDGDDPTHGQYVTMLTALRAEGDTAWLADVTYETRMPMVHKLNTVAVPIARTCFALGFAGDDHRPRTFGWAARYISVLREMGCGIVYGDDLLQRAALPTQWAMTADIVRAWGAMVPAPVEHMFCDNAILAVGEQTAAIRYLSDVIVEHVHPAAGKADWDDTYELAGGAGRLEADRDRYAAWVGGGGLAEAAGQLRALRTGMAAWRR